MPGHAHSSMKRKLIDFMKSNVGAALLTFLTTGVGAALFSNYLSNISRNREAEVADTRRAVDSVKSVTDLIFERDTRANFLASSIRRHAATEELKTRKSAYDDVFVRYNFQIQSNLFRIREIFRSADYTDFEKLLEGPLRDLLIAEDDCLTNSYDAALASTNPQATSDRTPDSALYKLTHCTLRQQEKNSEIEFRVIHQEIIHCEYTYSDALFRIVEQITKDQEKLQLEEDHVRQACTLQK